MKYFTWTRSLAALLLAPGLAGAAPALIESHTLNTFGKRYSANTGIHLADTRGASTLGFTDFARAMNMRSGDGIGDAYPDLGGAISSYANGNLGSWSSPSLRHGWPEARASYAKEARAGFGTAHSRQTLQSQSVPEPETYVMLAVGVAVIVFTRGTRKRLQDSLDA